MEFLKKNIMVAYPYFNEDFCKNILGVDLDLVVHWD